MCRICSEGSDLVLGAVVALIVLVIGTYPNTPKLRKIIGWLLIVCSVVVLAAMGSSCFRRERYRALSHRRLA
jgi:multisubunit Na+/H+ antiporter MnhB subunit